MTRFTSCRNQEHQVKTSLMIRVSKLPPLWRWTVGALWSFKRGKPAAGDQLSISVFVCVFHDACFAHSCWTLTINVSHDRLRFHTLPVGICIGHTCEEESPAVNIATPCHVTPSLRVFISLQPSFITHRIVFLFFSPRICRCPFVQPLSCNTHEGQRFVSPPWTVKRQTQQASKQPCHLVIS